MPEDVNSRYERVVHRSHPEGELSDSTREWISRQPASIASIVEMERLRQENPETWAFLTGWAHRHRDRLRLLRLLVESKIGVTYQEVFYRVESGERAARGYVAELRDEGIVEVEGNPAQIRFADDDAYVLAKDVAALL